MDRERIRSGLSRLRIYTSALRIVFGVQVVLCAALVHPIVDSSFGGALLAVAAVVAAAFIVWSVIDLRRDAAAFVLGDHAGHCRYREAIRRVAETGRWGRIWDRLSSASVIVMLGLVGSYLDADSHGGPGAVEAELCWLLSAFLAAELIFTFLVLEPYAQRELIALGPSGEPDVTATARSVFSTRGRLAAIEYLQTHGHVSLGAAVQTADSFSSSTEHSP